MDTATRRPFYLVGLVVACVLIGSVLFVSFDVISYRADLRPAFYLGLQTEITATLLFLPLFLLEDAVKAKKLTIHKSAHRRISGGLHLISFILAVLGALHFYIEGEYFMTSMVLVIHPATLLALVCAYTLISDIIFDLTAKNHRAN